MKAKSNKGKMPAGAPKGMNPFEFFRKGGEQRKAMFKKGGYNTPTQNPLPKRNMGGPGDDPFSTASYVPKATPSVPSASSLMTNPFVRPNPLTNSLSYKPSFTRPTTTSSVVPTPTPAPVSVVPTPTPTPVAEPSFKEKKKALKEQGKLDKIQRRLDIKKAKDENLQKQYETGERNAETTGDKIDRAVKVGETVIGGMNAVNQFRRPMGGGDPFENKRGGSIKTKMKSGGVKPKASKGMIVKSKRK
jgi:hypothetical protein